MLAQRINSSMEQPPHRSSSVSEFVRCSVCTFENNRSDSKCEMCGAGMQQVDNLEPKVIRLTMQKVHGRKFGLSIASLPDGHYVEKVQESGLAADTGQVSVGMKLVAINGTDTNPLSKQDCITLFREAKDRVTLDLIDAPRPKEMPQLAAQVTAKLADHVALTPSSPRPVTEEAQASTNVSPGSVPFPGRKMSTPETYAAMEHVENLTRMLDSLRSFSGVVEEGQPASPHPEPTDEEIAMMSPPPSKADHREVIESFVNSVISAAKEGPVDGQLVYGLLLEHWGDESEALWPSTPTTGGAETPLSPSIVPGAKSVMAKEKDRLQRRIWRLESESRAIAKRLLDQQTTFAQQLNELESENESLRAYVDKLMCQLLSARMEQQLTDDSKRKSMSSPRMRRPMSAAE